MEHWYQQNLIKVLTLTLILILIWLEKTCRGSNLDLMEPFNHPKVWFYWAVCRVMLLQHSVKAYLSFSVIFYK